MEPKIEIGVLQNENNPEVIVRTGTASELKPPNKIVIIGDIASVKSFIDKRKLVKSEAASAEPGTTLEMCKVDKYSCNLQMIHTDLAIITTDKKAKTIKLEVDPQDAFGVTVTGILEDSEEIKQFCINQNKMFNREELVKLLRFARMQFSNVDVHDTVLKAYQKFNVQAHVQLQQENDTRGNRTNNLQKTVETNLPDSFVLNIPIFKGQQNETFRVDICIDVTDASAKFWFESVELHELTQKRIDEIFAEQLKGCTDFVIINK
jgi:hypothetical protein